MELKLANMNCRHCGTNLENVFLDLAFAPPSNSYLSPTDLQKPEVYYPLRVMVCHNCWLVQTEDYAKAEVFFNSDYAYFSSTSLSWLAHAKEYADKMIADLHLDAQSKVVEIASNDGYLLKNFLQAGIPCLGIEPTKSTALEAEKLGIPVLQEFFTESMGSSLANKQGKADLIIGNNVYAHVPDINDFTKGLKALLRNDGTITLEFPHLLSLLRFIQFDTIYHEHFSYLSLYTVSKIFLSDGLRIWKVDEIPTHGGSIRVYGCHTEDQRQDDPSVHRILDIENEHGLQDILTYTGFQTKVDTIKYNLLHFLLEQKKENKRIIAYGAAAKGNTLLNYAGVRADLLPVVYDAAPAKQFKFMPGSHIPILPAEQIFQDSADYLLILPWNIADEVIKQLAPLQERGIKFIIAVPQLSVV
jgi:SAM-dependent methyltransferase